jgi:hypothetical protein
MQKTIIMSRLSLFVFALIVVGCLPSAQQQYDRAMARLDSTTTELTRFVALGDAAKRSVDIGDFDQAIQLATELEALTPVYVGTWNEGNAIQDVNIVYGRVALKEGRIEDAKSHLLAAGSSHGSPQMDTFGPDFSLARDLLEIGESEVVLQYFEQCRSFWDLNDGRLDAWAKEVQAGKIPDMI